MPPAPDRLHPRCPPIRVLALALAIAMIPPSVRAEPPSPPLAKRIPRPDTTLGDVRVDDYYWLRDRDNPEVIAHLDAENRWTEEVLKPTAALQETLYREMLSRLRETDLTVPARDGDWYYYSRTEQGKQYPIYCRRPGSLEAPEQVILDVNTLAEGLEYFHVGALVHSPDHGRLAYTVDTDGSEHYTLVVKDLATGELHADRVTDILEDVEWGNDNCTLFYLRADEARRPFQLVRHVLGRPESEDALVFHEPDPLFDLELSKSRDRRWLVLSSASFTSAEVRVLEADRPAGEWRVVRPRTRDVLYSLAPRGDEFFILTNEHATDFKVMRAPAANPGAASWREYIPHRDSVLITDLDAFRDHLVVWSRARGLRQIEIHDLGSGESHRVSFPEPVYTCAPERNLEFDTRLLRLTYQSPVSPPAVYDYDMKARTRELRKLTEVPGYDPSLYATARAWARSPDGREVPISLLYRKPLVRDGARAALLYGYGAYGLGSEPRFNSVLFSLVDRGFVYAIAHVRGGDELGRRWYDDGKLLAKKNTFTDFVACAEHLIAEQITSRDRLAIRGGSAGGLLIGAVLNLRPDLFRAAVADVPFVDVITTMKDPSIPLTTQEWEEWGDPRDAKYYAYMKSYSPYDHVAERDVPALLVTAGLNDPRVGFWEPAKWVAKLRALKTDRNPLLFRVNMDAGHAGSSGRYDNLREQALRHAFVLAAVDGRLGRTPADTSRGGAAGTRSP